METITQKVKSNTPRNIFFSVTSLIPAIPLYMIIVVGVVCSLIGFNPTFMCIDNECMDNEPSYILGVFGAVLALAALFAIIYLRHVILNKYLELRIGELKGMTVWKFSATGFFGSAVITLIMCALVIAVTVCIEVYLIDSSQAYVFPILFITVMYIINQLHTLRSLGLDMKKALSETVEVNKKNIAQQWGYPVAAVVLQLLAALQYSITGMHEWVFALAGVLGYVLIVLPRLVLSERIIKSSLIELNPA